MSHVSLSVIIPTYNEAKNIELIILRVLEAAKKAQLSLEIVIVDDDSPDGTARLATEMGKRLPVRVYVRTQRLGPGAAIMDGIRLAIAPVVCVMDGDLSHPPEAIPEMYKLIRQGKAELVIGSRHVQGGGTSRWIWYRKFFSWGARLLGRFLTPVNDLTSGFFMFDKNVFDGAQIEPIGCKVGLELMVKGNHHGKVAEYPIVFLERAAGESKMGWRETQQYLYHLLALTGFRLKNLLHV